LAVKYSHVDVVKALIKEGADVNKADGFTNLNDETYALLKNAALLEAAKNDDVDEVGRLITIEASVNAVDKDGSTPLHLAAANGHTKIVSALIKREGINVYAEDNKNNAPLDLARQNDYKEVVKVLEQAQKNIEALCSVVKNGNAQEVETLLQNLLQELLDDPSSTGANVNIVGEDGKTPLHLAVLLNKTEMVKILIGYSENVNIVDEDGKTPLHLSAQNNNKEIVDALIRAKANVNIKDKDGKTPFDLTTDEEIKALLKKAAEKTDPVDESSTDSKGNQEEDADKEKQEGNVQAGPDVIKKENSEEESQRKQDINGEKGTDEKTGSAQPVAPTESNAPIQSGDVQGTISTGEEGTAAPTQNNGSTTSAEEEQPSSFFGSLFSILMKPFSLIASFFGGFFSWLFGSDTDESTSETDANVSLLRSGDEEDNSGDRYSATDTDL
jgi:ankyrin repeat protein